MQRLTARGSWSGARLYLAASPRCTSGEGVQSAQSAFSRSKGGPGALISAALQRAKIVRYRGIHSEALRRLGLLDSEASDMFGP